MNKKVYETIMSGQSDNNIEFRDFCNVIEACGFQLVRYNGSHRVYRNSEGLLLVVQPRGSKAKAYQVAQFREVMK